MKKFDIITAADGICAAIYILRQANRANYACIEAVGDPSLREEAEDYAHLCELALERLQKHLDTVNEMIEEILKENRQ